MSFTSPVFLLFLPVALLLVRLFPPRRRYLPLLPLSCVFYAFHDPALLLLMLLTVLVAYGSALRIARATDVRGRKRSLRLCVFFDLTLLGLFKYLAFLGGCLSALFRGHLQLSLPSLPLPMGISFYIFQSLSYVLDVYRGRLQAERRVGLFTLYVIFFPQLVAGPIERAGDLLPQLEDMRDPNREDLVSGLRLLLSGYAKKILIADVLAPFVDTAYADPLSVGGAAMLCATLLFYAQIFCDFSGYTDIARGCARLMGVRLSENFREPYLADSFQDFWHRWHITLSRFFLDAVYLPLGGNRKGRWKTGCNLLIVFLMSGLWHGANWTYVVWGAVHGLLLAAERMLPQRLRKSGSPILRRAFVFSMVTLSWIFFRAPDLASAFRIFGLILTDFRLAGCLTGLGMTPCEAVMTFGLLILVPLLSPQSLRTLSARRFLPVCLLILLILLSRCLTLSVSGDPAFLYFQF